jgi:hypothetical protein
MKVKPDVDKELAREAARMLVALGGTMPGIKSIPRRRSEPSEDVAADNSEVDKKPTLD